MIDAFQSDPENVSTGGAPQAEMNAVTQKAESLEAGTLRDSSRTSS
jgi:hypothetical protein